MLDYLPKIDDVGRGTQFVGIGTIILFSISIFIPFVSSEYYTSLITLMFVWGIFAISFNFCFGFANLPSFGHAAFFGIGVYSFAITFTKVVDSVVIAFLVAIFVAILYGAVIGRVSIRGKGIYFALLTFAFAQSLHEIVIRTPNLTGASNGIFISDPSIAGVNLSSYVVSYYGSLVILALVLLFGYQLINSPLGEAMAGIKHNEERMRALGYNVTRIKVLVFILSGVLSSIAGVLYLINTQFAGPGLVDYTTSVDVIIMTVVGGTASLVGPAIGAIIILAVEELVSDLSNVGTIIIGLVFISVILVFKGGIVTYVRDYLN